MLTPEFASVTLPEYVGVTQPVHELHLAQHVGFIAGQRVHLQRHHLARDAVLHLQQEEHTVFSVLSLFKDPLQELLLLPAEIRDESKVMSQ